VAGCCECGDEPSGSCATELVMFFFILGLFFRLSKYWVPQEHVLGLLLFNVFINDF
jgi:hypothetical protein